MPELGVLGSLVWDEIHGRDPRAAPVEEWGGIAYALSAFDASLPADWTVVPLIKVGRDLAPRAREFMAGLRRAAPGARFIETDAPNNRVTLRYQEHERRCERMAGGVPGWTWTELGPLVRGLDALYLNFISGFELGLGTAEALRRGFPGPIYADLHSLFLGLQQDGIRVLRDLPEAEAWLRCFDVVQVNEEEMRRLDPDPMAAAAAALGAGVSLLVVTLGPRGAVYFCPAGWSGLGDRAPRSTGPVRTAILAPPVVDPVDPTGCGDVFGAALCSRLLAGDGVEPAIAHANRLAARNAGFRGATGLARHLRGELVPA